MNKKEWEAFAKRIVHFYENFGNQDIAVTCNHFMTEGFLRNTICRIIKRYLTNGTTSWKLNSGRPPVKSTKKNVKLIKNMFTKNPNCSVRNAAQKLKLKKSTVSDIKVKKLGIKAYRKQTTPKYNSDQADRAKTKCRILYRKRLLKNPKKIVVMDDETYVPIDPDQIPGLEFYHCINKKDVPDKAVFKGKTKFPKKFIIWQCLDEKGNVSEPFVSTGTINGDVYLEECLKKRLIPFIKKYHNLENVLFWPDMASSHYRKDVIDWLEKEGVDFVRKSENAPNVPQARPIEKFWALCKANYKKQSKPAKNLTAFKKSWKKIAKKVASESAQDLMKEARRNLRLIGYNDVFAPYKTFKT